VSIVTHLFLNPQALVKVLLLHWIGICDGQLPVSPWNSRVCSFFPATLACLGLIEDSPWICFRMTALAGAAAVLRDGLCTVENVVPLGTIDEVTAHTSSIITEV
jgi:hypothetical protein